LGVCNNQQQPLIAGSGSILFIRYSTDRATKERRPGNIRKKPLGAALIGKGTCFILANDRSNMPIAPARSGCMRMDASSQEKDPIRTVL
jgi:hypothetical protein